MPRPRARLRCPHAGLAGATVLITLAAIVIPPWNEPEAAVPVLPADGRAWGRTLR